MICPHCNQDTEKKSRMTPEVKELVKQGFEHFWLCWRNCKKAVEVNNYSTRSDTLKKFNQMFGSVYWNSHSQEDFREEINDMCDYAKDFHKQEGFNPSTNMMTGRFLTLKGWK